MDHEQHARTAGRSPVDQVASALRVSRAQGLAIDHRVDAPTIREHLVQLCDERNRIRAVLRDAPSDQTRNISALQHSRDELQESLRHERDELAALERRHPIRHRKQHAARRLATTHRVDVAETRLDDTERALARAVEQQEAHVRIVSGHRDAVDRLPTIERDIERRLDQLVDSYRHEPPAYLATLGSEPGEPDARSRWTAAARVIENYRYEHAITHEEYPFGPPDRTDYLQRLASAQVEGILDGLHPGRGYDAPNVGLDLE